MFVRGEETGRVTILSSLSGLSLGLISSHVSPHVDSLHYVHM